MQERMKKQAEVTSDTPMGGLPSVSESVGRVLSVRPGSCCLFPVTPGAFSHLYSFENKSF